MDDTAMNTSVPNYTDFVVENASSISKIPAWEWFVRIGIFMPLTILYCIIFYEIVSKPKDFNSPYFGLIKALAVTDFLEIIYDLHLFVYQWIGVYYPGEIFGKYFRLLSLVSAWYANSILHFFVGINRFCAIVYFQKYKQLFTKKITITILVISILYAIGCSLVWVVYCGLSLKLNPKYKPSEYLLGCDPRVENAYYIFDVGVGFAIFVVVLIVYVFCGFVSFKRLKSFTGSKATYIREIKMMCQGVILILVFGAVLIVYYAPIPGLSVNAELFQTFYSCINAVVYLVLDKKLQKHVFNVIFRCGKKSNQVATSAVTGSLFNANLVKERG